MLRRLPAAASAAILAGVLALPVTSVPSSARTGGDPAAAKAWILVDAGTGEVLAALDHHEPHFVASLVKVMTALVTLEQLQITNDVEVSPLAAAQPAMRIGMETGQVWSLDDALHSLLMVSANDAAYALAEASAGTLNDFAALMQRTAERLGMRDSTWLDPAGFDGDEGFRGGTRASAYDLAIATRNLLEVPELAAIVAKRTYEFEGGDGDPHTLTNHNKLLGTFPDSSGVKTGYTRAAGHSLIASARRGDRELIAVVIGASDHYGTAASLLEQGFATRSGSGGGSRETLPATSFERAELPVEAEETTAETAATDGGGIWSAFRRLLFVLSAGLVVAFFARREQIKRRKRRRRAMRRAYLDAKRRGMIDVIDVERAFGPNRARGQVEVARPRRTPDDDVWPPREWEGRRSRTSSR